ncbi:MAG TPA: phage tail protein [Thermoanaerobaculia bacterium]|nr:phage tail protein [Thermoanaerobaculia bacterium]
MKPLAATRDANDATWYALEYASDFLPKTDPTLDPWVSPALDSSLFYDDERHVLELLPVKPATEAEPPPGLAIDVDGRVYGVDPSGQRVLVRCGGSEKELICERGVLGSPAGLALDRRGLLYIADPPVHRVLVVLPDDGSLAGILAGGLEEPVDVAPAPDGRIYVADRKAGKIVVFNGRFDRCSAFVPKDAEGSLVTPRPIAVMIDDDGAVLVADASYPRLLRMTPEGEPLGDRELRSYIAEGERASLLEAFCKNRGPCPPVFHAAVCGPCRPARDGGDALAAMQREIRLHLLSLGHAFAPSGSFVSAALDGGTPGIAWHKVEIDADLPEGTWLKVQTVTADNPSKLGNLATIPTVGPDEDLLTLLVPTFVPFEDSSPSIRPRMPSDVPDRLVFSPPGRYLRLRLTLGSDGSATPSVRAVRVYHPRASYLDLLPRLYRRDRESAFFLEHFLALFEHVFTGIEDRYELFTRQLNPDAAPLEILNWLACLINLSFDPSWPLERRRALVQAAMELYATRGTPRGLARYVEIYTGRKPVILESFLERPLQPAFLGLPGALLGSTTHLGPPAKSDAAEELFLSRWAHRFTVLVFLDDACDEAVTLGVVDRIVTVNKPAHTVHALRPIRADARVGAARVGIDLMLGAREAARTLLGGCADPSGLESGSILGADAVLGERRPQYPRPIGLTL